MSNQIMTHAIKEPMSENPNRIVIAVKLKMTNAIKKLNLNEGNYLFRN